jgi:hypothetical protein
VYKTYDTKYLLVDGTHGATAHQHHQQRSTLHLFPILTPTSAPPKMYVWIPQQDLTGKAAFEDYRDEFMCCVVIYHTEYLKFCSVCGGDHTMTERRVKCASSTCDSERKCAVRWKVHVCSTTDIWRVLVNTANHGRRAAPCCAKLAPKLTEGMKEFIKDREEQGDPPRVTGTKLKKQIYLKLKRRAWPNASQLENYIKRVRRDGGTKNTVEAIMAYVRGRAFTPETPQDKAFVFAPSVDIDGYPHVGTGEDNDAFLLGVITVNSLRN